tara:strand:- start:491 stop:868 length:378 start_codon:yes stop_codon:yes gene_type:complete
MAVIEGMENWQLNFSVEVRDEEVADGIFGKVQELLDELGHTQWSGKMYRDLNMEKALEVFRENKEEILAALPEEVIQQYYPDRVAVSDEIKEKYSHLIPETQQYMQRKHNSLERHLEVVPELEEE